MSALLSSLDAEEKELLHCESAPTWKTPMLATLTEDRFSDPGWLYERKFDGERCLGLREGATVRLLTRNGKDAASTYPELIDALGAQEATSLVVDGEVVAFEGARTSFATLQGRSGLTDPEQARETGIDVFYYVFDLLHWDGHDLTGLPQRTRKNLLRRALTFEDPLRFSTHRLEHGEEMHEEACAKGWEGVIAKRAEAPYQHGRSTDWLKFKCVRDQELVVGCWTDPRGSRAGLGALLVGYHEDGALHYAGKVGTGFTERALSELRTELDRISAEEPPFVDREALPRSGVHWVEPRLVAAIGFTEWTRDGRLRHPRFQGLRRDKRARDVVREQR
ncbi:non-homologous end-joining DNA ligase [Brachybacterium saurashtrense]|uniref:DNA ligase (ATP) n=1 Tax=Brachybacterium saurashtrense TaxID=556288 RepID=A0A345YNF5_9MICO|nr:non-homologous end-joining DNA ligase [Brachybacterium saurashtrense]AXK45457.1 ATP-dependent DNA ligase [Brachybacterium saurashtrense]RRR21170.1 ATP-dependent DNA ligase [Brachybacterium saurashtrense]